MYEMQLMCIVFSARKNYLIEEQNPDRAVFSKTNGEANRFLANVIGIHLLLPRVILLSIMMLIDAA